VERIARDSAESYIRAGGRATFNDSIVYISIRDNNFKF